jgi:hypothetical protein
LELVCFTKIFLISSGCVFLCDFGIGLISKEEVVEKSFALVVVFIVGGVFLEAISVGLGVLLDGEFFYFLYEFG